MIKWSNELYFDDSIKKKPDKWKKRIEDGRLSHSLYCICLASNEKNLFDIINCNELFFRYYRRNSLYIVGIAKTREDAIDLLQDMIEDIYKKTGDIKVRDFFTF
ncbi:MAG: hypothetical protein ACERKN_05555 [Velocimicrobium sp.]